MLKIAKDLYKGNKLPSEEFDSILEDLKKGIINRNYYIITLSLSADDNLDIIHSFFLRNESQRKALPLIVGIACDRMEAFVLVNDILDETMRHCGNTDIRNYLLTKDQS